MFPALLALKQNECNMACLYRKNRSPDWYIQYLDSESIKHDRSTGLRTDDPNDTAKAKAMRAELEANEHRKIPLLNGAVWDNRVLKYFERHCQSPRTLQRHTGNLSARKSGRRDAVKFPISKISMAIAA